MTFAAAFLAGLIVLVLLAAGAIWMFLCVIQAIGPVQIACADDDQGFTPGTRLPSFSAPEPMPARLQRPATA
jgi:hypothetical protein